MNYVDSITFDNTFLDTWYDLGYDRDNYELNISWKFNENLPGIIFQWEGGAFSVSNSTIEGHNIYYYESFYYNGHGTDRPYNNNIPYTLRESYEEEDEGYHYSYYLISNGTYHSGGTTANKYYNNTSRIRKWGRLLIGSLDNEGTAEVGEITLKVNGVLVMDLKPCISGGVPCFYDTVRERYFYPDGYLPSHSMIKTVVMTGYRQTLPIDDGIEVDKIDNRIIEVNKYTDGYAGMYNEIAISADEDNYEGVEISDYTIDKQINQGGVADFIELKPRGTLVLPRNKQIAALNRPMVKGHKGDLLRIVVR